MHENKLSVSLIYLDRQVISKIGKSFNLDMTLKQTSNDTAEKYDDCGEKGVKPLHE